MEGERASARERKSYTEHTGSIARFEKLKKEGTHKYLRLTFH